MIRLLYWSYQIYLFIFRPVTYGVRVLATRGDQVLLVRHTYKPGWYLPGGGIQRHETPAEAGRREVREEAGVELGELRLGGIDSTLHPHFSGHELLFLGECSPTTRIGTHDAEIAEAGFFSVGQLPADLLPIYRERIQTLFQAQQAPARGILERT